MAIALDTAGTGPVAFTTQNGTISHTCAGANLILFALIGLDDSGAVRAGTVLYNGAAMTQQGTSANQSNKKTAVWYLINPSTGANNLVVQLSGVPAAGAAVRGISYTGVSQTTPMTGSVTGNASSQTTAGTLTVGTANDWIVAAMAQDASFAATIIGSTVNRGSVNISAFTKFYAGDNGPVPTTGTTGWTIATTAQNWTQYACSFSAAAGVASVTPVAFRNLLGVGF